MVIDHGAVPIFVKLLASPSDDVREQVYINFFFKFWFWIFSRLRVMWNQRTELKVIV